MSDISGNIFSQQQLPQFDASMQNPYCSCITRRTRPYYTLFVHLDTVDTELVVKYKNLFEKLQEKTTSYMNGNNNCIDAGIDIFTPFEHKLNGLSNKVKTSIRCAMYFNDGTSSTTPSGFHVYPRSSTGASTPLRLANSVGIIDAGYRGELMGLFDNHSASEYVIEKYQRVLQICAPNLTYPIYPVLVDNLSMLDIYIQSNDRGSGGLGSTGV
jgi:dUTP pyrophosphatase